MKFSRRSALRFAGLVGADAAFNFDALTSAGAAIPVKGLGYMDPALIAATADTVTKYMGVRSMPELSQLYTNKFVGSVKLCDKEWSDVSGRSEKYVPRHL